MHRRPQGGARGALAPPPLEFEKMTSYAAVLQNTLKFSLAPSALAIYTLNFSIKRREKTQQCSFAPSARRKMVDFLYGAPKTCWVCKVSVTLSPSGKISVGAHDSEEDGVAAVSQVIQLPPPPLGHQCA